MVSLDWLPYSDRPSVRAQAERLFSRKMLGSVLVGKFIGDYAAILTVRALGTHIGYVVGIVVAIGVFVYWEILAKRAEAAATGISEAQRTVDEYTDGDQQDRGDA
jgi:hypothetical protein